jgi:hypothetical protein
VNLLQPGRNTKPGLFPKGNVWKAQFFSIVSGCNSLLRDARQSKATAKWDYIGTGMRFQIGSELNDRHQIKATAI